MSENTPPLIVLLVAPETSPSVLYGMYDVLYSVGVVYPDMTLGEPGQESLDVRIVSHDGKPFRCLGNIVVEPSASITDINEADVVIVCDMYTSVDQPPRGKYLPEIAWLQNMHKKGSIICSICSGSLVLAEAGLLDGRRAASHWAYDDLFRRHYPAVKMQKESVLCLSDAADGIITVGSATAWQDLTLYLIALLCGQQQARYTAKIFLLSGHEDGQLPFAVMNRRVDTSDNLIADCQNGIAENYAISNPVQLMIERSHLNGRTFAWRFRQATGYQSLDYVQTLRMEEAKQVLETEDRSIEEISESVGYEDAASFRRLFKRKAGLTPAAYRRKFANLVLA